MDNQNIENWEKELKNKLGDLKEATSSKDLDAFMGKLDSKAFFKSSGKSYTSTWAFLVGVAIAGVAIYMLSGEQSEDPKPEVSPVIEYNQIKYSPQKQVIGKVKW